MPEVKTAVYLEVGQKRTFACALDWPGLCRAGRDEPAALAALAAALPRYAPIVRAAGASGTPSAVFEVVARLDGSATTDFGAPGAIPASDHDPLTPAEATRLVAIVRAAWEFFDAVVASAPAALTRGPRGGGRERDKIVEHVLGAESAYARKLGIRLKQPAGDDVPAVQAHRQSLAAALEAPDADAGWPPRYAARRIAWHALDHAWEIEDRTPVAAASTARRSTPEN